MMLISITVIEPVLVSDVVLRSFIFKVNACSTFNVLNAEDRRVAAALIQISAEEEPEED